MHLEHHGIKGQKWGVRRKQNLNAYNPQYSQEQRRHDSKLYGSRTSRQINKRMNKKLVDHDTAERYIVRRNAAIGAAASIAVGVGTAFVAKKYSYLADAPIAKAKKTVSNGQKAVNSMLTTMAKDNSKMQRAYAVRPV
ncbi:MAG: hypothetical protein HUJ78_02905 [Mogibacterium sp.]|nr:hypothetical protein [Mogibacterium sp.]MCF0239800.1 hypothetical protein [Streptococcus gallolyticus]